MKTYTPLWSTLVQSSVWGLAKEVKILWITMLAIKDDEGLVESTIPGLARMSDLTIEEVTGSLKILESPDPYSSSKEHEGRRIRAVAGGWVVLNHDKYRDQMLKQREYNRLKQARYRAKKLKEMYPAMGHKPAAGEAKYVRDYEDGVVAPEGTDHFREESAEYGLDKHSNTQGQDRNP